MSIKYSEVYRFVERVILSETGCWLWIGKPNLEGYSFFKSGAGTMAHRWSYEYFKGPIPKGLQIDHLCRNRACVNPDHLEAVTQKENLRRGNGICAKNIRKTHCKYGHPLTEDNLCKTKLKERRCKLCSIRRDKARREKERKAKRK